MASEIGLLTIHGIGTQEQGYSNRLRRAITKYSTLADWESLVSFGEIYYQDLLQANQERYRQAAEATGLRKKILRNLMLNSFSDAGSLEHKAQEQDSIYEQMQYRILEALEKIYDECNGQPKPVIIVAHSLGGHLISNYIWDAQQTHSSYGIWKYRRAQIAASNWDKESFLQLKSMRYLFTMGCNIPLLVAGHPHIEAINKANAGYNFRWDNYYDKDDPLGWPLQPLSPSYRDTVDADIAINAGGLFIGNTLFSHNEYWDAPEFVRPLVTAMAELLPADYAT